MGTGVRDTGGLIWNRSGLWVTNRYVNKSTELIKSHSFVWCQMWDVTLKWTTDSTGFGEAKGVGAKG